MLEEERLPREPEHLHDEHHEDAELPRLPEQSGLGKSARTQLLEAEQTRPLGERVAQPARHERQPEAQHLVPERAVGADAPGVGRARLDVPRPSLAAQRLRVDGDQEDERERARHEVGLEHRRHAAAQSHEQPQVEADVGRDADEPREREHPRSPGQPKLGERHDGERVENQDQRRVEHDARRHDARRPVETRHPRERRGHEHEEPAEHDRRCEERGGRGREDRPLARAPLLTGGELEVRRLHPVGEQDVQEHERPVDERDDAVVLPRQQVRVERDEQEVEHPPQNRRKSVDGSFRGEFAQAAQWGVGWES